MTNKLITNIFLFPLILIAADMAVFLATDMYLPALPSIMDEFGLSQAQAQFTLSAWFLGGLSMQLFIGPLCDRVGRRPILIIGMIIFVIATLICALAPNLFILIVGRFLQGCTISFIIVPGYASIHELYEQKKAVQILAMMSSITILAPAIGPFIGGLLSTLVNWRWIFLSLFFIGLLMTSWLVARMPETLEERHRHPLELALIVRQYKSIVKNWHFMHYLLPYALVFCGFMSWLLCGPFLIIHEFHYKPVYFGLFQMLVFGFYMLANRLVRSLVKKIELKQLIESGLLIIFLGGLFSFAMAFMYPNRLVGLIIGMTLFAFGFGLSSASLQRLAIEASDAPMGSRMAILSTCLGVFGLLSTALIELFYRGNLSSLASILLVVSVGSCLIYRSGKHYRLAASLTPMET